MLHYDRLWAPVTHATMRTGWKELQEGKRVSQYSIISQGGDI